MRMLGVLVAPASSPSTSKKWGFDDEETDNREHHAERFIARNDDGWATIDLQGIPETLWPALPVSPLYLQGTTQFEE